MAILSARATNMRSSIRARVAGVQDGARAMGARERALFDGAQRGPGRERPRAVLLPKFRCSDVPMSWGNRQEHRNIDATAHTRGRLRVPGARFVPTRAAAGKLIGQRSEHRPQNALSLAPRAIHGEAAPDYGTTPSRRPLTAARRRSPPPHSDDAPPSETPKRNINARRARGPAC